MTVDEWLRSYWQPVDLPLDECLKIIRKDGQAVEMIDDERWRIHYDYPPSNRYTTITDDAGVREYAWLILEAWRYKP